MERMQENDESQAVPSAQLCVRMLCKFLFLPMVDQAQLYSVLPSGCPAQCWEHCLAAGQIFHPLFRHYPDRLALHLQGAALLS